MGDIIDLHERLSILEVAHNNLVTAHSNLMALLQEKKIIPKAKEAKKKNG